MFKLDDNFLVELGLGSLPPAEKNKMLSHIYETLEMKVGMRLAEKMSNEQLDEFESYINGNDEQGALKWLETNFPNYKQVVAEELEKLKSEIKQVAPQILAQAASAPQPQQAPAPAAVGPPPQQQAVPASPTQQPAYDAAQPAQPAYYQQNNVPPAQPASYAQAQQMPPAQPLDYAQAPAAATTPPMDSTGSFDLSNAPQPQHVQQPQLDGVDGGYSPPQQSYGAPAASSSPSPQAGVAASQPYDDVSQSAGGYAPSQQQPAGQQDSVYSRVTSAAPQAADPLGPLPPAPSPYATPAGQPPAGPVGADSGASLGSAFDQPAQQQYGPPQGDYQQAADPMPAQPQQPQNPGGMTAAGTQPPSAYHPPAAPPIEPYQPPQ